MSEKQLSFEGAMMIVNDNKWIKFKDIEKLSDFIQEQQAIIEAKDSLLSILAKENEQLRLELKTHKNPLWSTREAERKVSELAGSLAGEVKKNGLLNEELNQLRIENMRLKKKGGE